MPTLPSERLDPRIEIAARIIRACRQQEVFADETAVVVIAALDAAPRVVTDAMVKAAMAGYWTVPVSDRLSDELAFRAALTAALASPPARDEGVEVRAAAQSAALKVVEDLLWRQTDYCGGDPEWHAKTAREIVEAVEGALKSQAPTLPAAVQEAER